MKSRILLVDNHAIIRDGLRSLLEGKADAVVVGEAEEGRTAVRLARELAPDLVIMDVAMPELNGIDATLKILEQNPTTRVIGLSMHSDVPYVSRMLQAGASAYLLKDCAFEELTEAIRVVRNGGIYLSPGITGVVVDDYKRLASGGDTKISVLTPKEREVLQVLAEGKTTKEIAAILHVSVKTADTHRQNIMRKLSLRSVAELTKFAVRHGLTSLD